MYVLSGMCIRTKKKSYLHSVDVLGGGGRRCRVRRARWCPSPLSLSRGMDILEVKHTTKASNEGKSIYSPHKSARPTEEWPGQTNTNFPHANAIRESLNCHIFLT